MAHWRVALVLVLAAPAVGALGSKGADSETCQQYPRDVAALLQGSVGVQRVAEVLSPVMVPVVVPGVPAVSGSMPPIVVPPTGNSAPFVMPPIVVPPTGVSGSKPPTQVGGGSKQGDQVGIHFGGAERDDGTGAKSIAYRPEAVHSEVCDGHDACVSCGDSDSMSNCWHGSAPNALSVTVPLGDRKIYVATMFASCTSNNGYWQIYEESLTNANLNVYLNDKVVAYKTVKDYKGIQRRQYKIMGDKIGKQAQIKVSLSAKDGGAASAKLVIYAMANKYVDTCMDRTFCLKKLGDKSQAAFELRNSNPKQYACLKGKTPPKETELVAVCEEWRKCFAKQNGNHEEELLKLLSAVFSKKSALLDVSRSLLAEDTQGCLDPAASDAEAVECECLDEMVAACKAATPSITDHEECFSTQMCKSKPGKICESWKEENCEDSLLMLRSSTNQKTNDTLDGSMTGKCTSETQ